MTDWTARRFPVLDVLEVHDGDTYRLMIDTGFEHAAYPWLRLNGWSCPELKQTNGPEAREAALELLSGPGLLEVTTHRTATPIVVKRYQDDKRTLTRYLADVWLPGDVHLGALLAERGLARKGARVG